MKQHGWKQQVGALQMLENTLPHEFPLTSFAVQRLSVCQIHLVGSIIINVYNRSKKAIQVYRLIHFYIYYC